MRRRYGAEGHGCAMAIMLLLLTVICIGIPRGCMGIGGCGPRNIIEATVERLYVDSNGDTGSSYMVATDKGIFEVDNGIFLGVWNSDEIYGHLKPGVKYQFVTSGNRVVNILFQQYPYVTNATEIKETK